jgi:3-oxo-5-alpha-steroid 4-dehydrogenase 3
MDLIFQTSLISSVIYHTEEVLKTVLMLVGIGRFEQFQFTTTQPWLPSLLLHAQLTRRLLESILIVRHDKSKMHVTHLIFALCYYPVVSLSINVSSVPVSTPVSVISVVLFLWTSFHQYRCHVILAELRAKDAEAYGIPYGDWFEYVSSPHYFAEILIYISIFISSGGGYLLGANCLYQIINFSLICTPPTHYWYLKKFENYPRRKILIPFVY